MRDVIEFLDDKGNLLYTTSAAHECVGDNGSCKDPAECEGCGVKATPETPVYVFGSPNDMSYFRCAECINKDKYVRFAEQGSNYEIHRHFLWWHVRWKSMNLCRVAFTKRGAERLRARLQRDPDTARKAYRK